MIFFSRVPANTQYIINLPFDAIIDYVIATPVTNSTVNQPINFFFDSNISSAMFVEYIPFSRVVNT